MAISTIAVTANRPFVVNLISYLDKLSWRNED
jgi:hypothetical protein